MDRIVIEFPKLDDIESLRCHRYVFRDRLRLWAFVALTGGVIALAGLAVAIKALLIAGGIVCVAGAAALVVLDNLFRQANRVQIRQQACRAVYTRENIAFESEQGPVSSMPWSSLVKVEKMRDSYLLYPAERMAIVVPRRLATSEEWEQFTQWAESTRTSLANFTGSE